MNRSAITRLLPLAALAAALPACERAAPDEQARTDPASAAPPAADASGEGSSAPGWNPTTPAGDDRIPAAMQGRWGLAPADCEPGQADATGALVITPRRLEFYESVATLTGIDESAPGSVRAQFAFTGEGMSWQRDMVLAMEQGGDVLVRRELGEDAAAGPFRYTRCRGESG